MNTLKLIIAWPLSWLFFWWGDLYSKILNLWDNEYWCAFWYMLYNDLMLWSYQVQDWAGGTKCFPWREKE